MKQDVSNYKSASIVFPSALVTGYDKKQPLANKKFLLRGREITMLGSVCSVIADWLDGGWGLVDVEHLAASLASGSSCV